MERVVSHERIRDIIINTVVQVRLNILRVPSFTIWNLTYSDRLFVLSNITQRRDR